MFPYTKKNNEEKILLLLQTFTIFLKFIKRCVYPVH